MDFRRQIARQPEIIRTKQKDSYYIEELAGNLSDLLHWLSIQKWMKYHHRCQLIAELAYHAFAILHRIQTLGEEYTGILQIDNNFKNIPSKYLQLIAILLEFCGETIYMKIFQYIENEFLTIYNTTTNNNRIFPEFKEKLKNFIYILKISPTTIQILHKCLFYILSNGKYQISKRLTGINYIRIRHWLQPQIPLFAYKILGLLTLLQIVSQIATHIWCWKWSHTTLTDTNQMPEKVRTKIPKSFNRSELRNCTLCLEERSATSLTPCGHLFCWSCLLHWLDEREECPLCREILKKSQILQLKNYI